LYVLIWPEKGGVFTRLTNDVLQSNLVVPVFCKCRELKETTYLNLKTMKKQLIFGSLLALSGLASAQWSVNGAHVYKTNPNGNVGIGTGNTPLFKLEIATNTASDDGTHITQSGAGNTSMFLRNPAGSRWGIHHTGSGSSLGGGHFLLENGGTSRVLINGTTGYCGIGTTSPGSRLHVAEANSSAGSGAFVDYSTGSAAGGNGITSIANSVGAVGTQQNIGVDGYGNCGAGGSSTAIGLRGSAAGGNRNYGGFFKTAGNGGSALTVGVYGILTNNNSTLNSALYGDANGLSNSGLDTWAGYFLGDIMVTGTPYSTAGGVWTASDRRYKKDINQLEGTLGKIAKLNGYSYKFKTEEFKDKNFSDREQLGFIAQELKEVFPQMVTEGPDGFNYVNYTAMIPVLLEAIKEQKQSTDAMKADLQKQINDQQQQISQLLEKTGTSTGLNNSGSVESGFAMSQNEPNPFTHETVINYTLPSQVGSAYVAVYDLSGKQISKFALDQKGAASITITSEKLAAGIYIYSIVADGKVMDSKRMIVADK
jgi:hypothetical protein